MQKYRLSFSIFLLLSLVGCSNYLSSTDFTFSDTNDSAQEEFISEWEDLSKGFSIREYLYNDVIFKIVRIDPEHFTFSIKQDINNPLTVREWHESGDDILTINGGYFKEDYTPSGGVIIGDTTSGTLTHTGINGYTGMIIIKDQEITLQYLPDKEYIESDETDFGLQSFPTIILPGGKSGVESDSGKKAYRSVIAQDTQGNIIFGINKQGQISLYEMMNFLQESDLSIDMALNLDGGPSTGMIIERADGIWGYDSLGVIPNVISVIER